MNLELLRARLKALAGEIEAMAKKDALSSEDINAIDEKTKELEEVEKNIATLERAEGARARAAQPANAPLVPAGTVAAQAKGADFTSAEKVGFIAVGMVKAKLDGGGTSARAVFKQLEEAGYGEVAKEFDTPQQRALNASSSTAGGVFVPDDISNDIIEILRPMTTFLRGGPRRVSLANGNYHMPAGASGATAYWRGEGKPIQPSQPTFTDINLSAKLLGALVPITDQLLRWSRVDIRDWVERDMAAAMAQELDRAAYFGSGTIYEPQGILNIGGVGTVAASGGTAPTVAQIEGDASKLELNMDMINLPQDRAAWVMSPRTLTFLQNLRDGNGNRYFPELQAALPTWRNKPVMKTTNMPVNLGAGTDESVLALINFGDVFFGESRALQFAVSTDASYVKNGQTVSAFQNELLLIRATTEVDVGLKYLQAVQKLTNIRWGA